MEGGGSCPSPLWDPGDICQCFQHAAPSRARRALLVTAPHIPHLQPAASVQDLGSGSWHLMAGGARTHLGRGTAPCGPIPNCPRPPGPAVLQLEPGRDAAGCAAPSPALPAPPKQPLSKGWSSKILTRAPSVYHTVNLGFQQLYDAAGRWERTKRSSSHSDTACVCQCPQRSLCARARGLRGAGTPQPRPPPSPRLGHNADEDRSRARVSRSPTRWLLVLGRGELCSIPGPAAFRWDVALRRGRGEKRPPHRLRRSTTATVLGDAGLVFPLVLGDAVFCVFFSVFFFF